MPPTLKYLLNTAKMIADGSSMTTKHAITEPQSVAFCWKNPWTPMGSVKMLLDLMNTKTTR